MFRYLNNIPLTLYGKEKEELDLGISSIAAPFFNADGYLAGTLSAVSTTATMDKISRALLTELKETCLKITDALFV